MASNRFERHPVRTWLFLLAAGLLAAEVALRIIDPSILEFVHEARQVHAYSRRWVVDLVPRQAAHLRLVDRCGALLYNFILTTGEDGFRIPDRARDLPPLRDGATVTRYVHAVGDSYTMGWGVDYASSYPARLEARLPAGWRVLNLGVDGFGTRAATEKSMALAECFPPAAAVYVFCSNDPDDDRRAEAQEAWPGVVSIAWDGFDVLRRNSYLANVPFAVRWARRFRPSCPPERPAERVLEGTLDARDWLVSVDEAPAEDPPGWRHLARYAAFLHERNAPLVVLAIDDDPPSRRFVAACRRHGIVADLLAPPPAARLRDDGHLNREGSDALARYLAGIRSRNLGLPPAAAEPVGLPVETPGAVPSGQP
jgi:hypothetical protein